MPERRYLVHGRVQGVGFRWWARAQAQQLGVTGTVRNRGDGSVEVVAAGSMDALSRLHSLLAQGPSAARVDRIDEEPISDVSATNFEIIT